MVLESVVPIRSVQANKNFLTLFSKNAILE